MKEETHWFKTQFAGLAWARHGRLTSPSFAGNHDWPREGRNRGTQKWKEGERLKLKRKRGEECEREILLLLLFTLGTAVDCSRRKSFRRHEVRWKNRGWQRKGEMKTWGGEIGDGFVRGRRRRALAAGTRGTEERRTKKKNEEADGGGRGIGWMYI